MNISTVLLPVAFLTFGLYGSQAYAWEPLGFPYEVFGEIRNTSGTENAIEDGTYFDLFAEQGMDISRVKNAVFNVFANTYIIKGGDPLRDWWNDSEEISGGVQFRFDFPTSGSLYWGNAKIGARISYKQYNNNPEGSNTDTRGVIFVNFGLGGDWKQ